MPIFSGTIAIERLFWRCESWQKVRMRKLVTFFILILDECFFFAFPTCFFSFWCVFLLLLLAYWCKAESWGVSDQVFHAMDLVWVSFRSKPKSYLKKIFFHGMISKKNRLASLSFQSHKRRLSRLKTVDASTKFLLSWLAILGQFFWKLLYSLEHFLNFLSIVKLYFYHRYRAS